MTAGSGGDPLRPSEDARDAPGASPTGQSTPGGELSLEPPAPTLPLERKIETEVPATVPPEPVPDAPPEPSAASPVVDPAPAAPAVAPPAAEPRSMWMEILRTPLTKGVLPGTIGLFAAMALVAWLEGGATHDDRGYQSWAQAAILIPSLAVLGLYARRITICTIEEREIPVGPDRADETTWTSAAGLFLVVVVVSLAPVFLWTSIQAAVGAPTWVSLAVVALCMVPAALHFPFAHAAVTLKADPLAAFPARSIAVWRRDSDSAKIAVGPSYAFFALFVLSITFSALFDPGTQRNFDPSEADLRRQAAADHTLLRDLGRAGMFVIRAGAVWAALVSARVSGLLARDVPAIREILER